MVPCKSAAGEVSFEWSHHRISSTDSKVRTTLYVSIVTLGEKGLLINETFSAVLLHGSISFSIFYKLKIRIFLEFGCYLALLGFRS